MMLRHHTNLTSAMLLLLSFFFGVTIGSDAGSVSSLLEGRFVTTTDVSGLLDFNLDIADMEASNNLEERLEIYKQGRNAYRILDPNTGEKETMSLASLSLNASASITENAMLVYFQRFFDQLGQMSGDNQDGFYKDQPAIKYADTIVSELLLRGDTTSIFETEAILVLNVWMAVINELYKVMKGCYQEYDVDRSLAALDNAIALWVGGGQSTGSNNDGYMLYWLAEDATSKLVGQQPQEGGEDGESWVNQRIIETANAIQTELLENGAQCSAPIGNDDSTSSSATIMAIRDKVLKMIDMMSIPLIQNTIHHFLAEEDSSNNEDDYEVLYSYSILPKISACDPIIANQLLNSNTTMDLIQRQEWVQTLMGTLNCFKLSCSDIGSFEDDNSSPKCVDSNLATTTTPLADYSATSPNAQLQSYVDRDIFQVQILMQSGATEPALDIYKNGYNSLYSLRDLAVNQAIPALGGSNFELFQIYYDTRDNDFIDKEIQAAIQGLSEYETASLGQRQEIVFGLITYQVLYLSIESAFQNAIKECVDGDFNASIAFWDEAVALYVGSYEGGSVSDGGQLLYGVSKRLCSRFGTCPEGSAANIIEVLSVASDFIASEHCTESENLLNERISPFLKIPLIQGTISAGLEAEDLSQISVDHGVIGKAHAFSRAILPFVNEVNEHSANMINRNLRFNEKEEAVQDGMEAVADAFLAVLPFEGTNCSDIGSLISSPLSFCSDGSLSPDAIHQIAFERYRFSYLEKVDLYSSLALDIRDMIFANSTHEAQTIYTEGSNALSSNTEDGLSNLTLSSFSADAQTVMSQDPMFNIFKYALYDKEAFDHDTELGFAYADEIVLEALGSTSDTNLAAEAAVVLNVWMMIAHQLYNAERSCRKRQQNAVEHLDIAAALWIGKDQTPDATDAGWLLYNVAQEAARDFGFGDIEAPINERLMSQFVDLQSLALRCHGDDSSVPDLVRVRIGEVLQSFSLILVQRLLVSISVDDKWRTELYASAVMSQCVGCNPDLHADLGEVFYSDFSKDKMDENVIENLALFLQCMRIPCEDIHAHPDSAVELKDLASNLCRVLDSNSEMTSVLEYEPTTIRHELARIDLDILQIGIFMRTGAFDAALDFFMHGQNSLSLISLSGSSIAFETRFTSLHDLIQVPDGLQVDHFDTFSQYFESETYAEDVLMESMMRSGPFESATRTQLSAATTRILQTIVSYRALATMLSSSIDACYEGEDGKASLLWDSGVAIFVGSINAYFSKGNSTSGETLHSLVIEQCKLFDSCKLEMTSGTTLLLLSQFQEGANLVQNDKCDEAMEIVFSDILPELQISFMQGLISEGFQNFSREISGIGMRSKKIPSDAPGAVEFVFAQSILPLVNASSEESAEIIAGIFDSPKSTIESPTTEEVVVAALKQALPGMGIACEDVGMLQTRLDLSLCGQYSLPEGFEKYAGFGLDVAAMHNALARREVDQARLIYSQGINVQRSIPGDEVPTKYESLQSLSTLATREMTEDPVFNLFQFHFGINSDEAELPTYADRYVQDAFEVSNEQSKTLAAEAAVVLNVWMYFIHTVYKSLAACRAGLGKVGAIGAIDEAVAFWLGDASESNSDGNLLFGLTAQMGMEFEREFVPFNLNDEILGRLRETKNHLRQSGECTTESMGSFSRRFELANEIASLATIPLLQGVILNLRAGDADRSKLFSTALVPRLSACSQGDYRFLKANLLEDKIDFSKVDAIIDALYATLPCLGLRCTQIGIHLSEIDDSLPSHPRCEIVANETSTIAGYKPEAEFWKVCSRHVL